MPTTPEALLAEMRRDCESAELELFTKTQLPKLVSIYRQTKEGPGQIVEHCGTGFLLNHNHKHYLISAAHVFDTTENFDLGTYKKSLNGLGSFIFVGTKHTTSIPEGGTRDDDFVDIGFMCLSQEAVAFLGPENFYTIDAFAIGHTCQLSSLYLALGYPNTQNEPNHYKRRIKRQPVSYSTHGAQENRFSYFKTHRNHHVILDFDKKRVNLSKGGTQSPPKSRGMSGGPIFHWKNYFTDDANAKKIVAISIENPDFDKKSVLIGTSVTLLFEALKKHPH